MQSKEDLKLQSQMYSPGGGGVTALVAGATGQVGQVLLALLLEQEIYRSITVLVRKPSGLHHPLVHEVVISDFDELGDYADDITADDVYLCLGTSSSKQSEFQKVDFVYPKTIAQLAFNHGASQLLFLSALGADASSKNLYFQVKGRVENELVAIGYASTHIFRPAVIYGSKDNTRPVQWIAKVISRLLAPILPTRLSKYLAISAPMVAQAMLCGALISSCGVNYYESDHIKKIATDRLAC